MNRVIEELKKNHIAIITALNQVKILGVNTVRGREQLLAVRTNIILHLAKEDASLYPLLRTAAVTDRRLQHILDSFSADAEEVSQSAQAFFALYSEGQGTEVADGFGMLLETLAKRIRMEEEVLFQEYARLCR